jgi:peptide/nickel transport system ATP-binding protein
LPEPAAIICRAVTRAYRASGGSVEALHAVDVRFPAGALSTVVGPSGCGKSTLLRLLGGLDRPDAGAVRVGGIQVDSLAPRALRRYRRDSVAFVHQHSAANLVPHLTLAEQLGPAEGRALVQRLGLESRVDARAEQLSGGEQARAALAVAMSRGTPVVLLDEPTAELDRADAGLVIDLLQDVVSDGRTVVVATHDPDLVAAADSRLTLTHSALEQNLAPRGGPRAAGRPPVLRVHDVTKSYGGRRVVKGVSLELRAGELAVLLGRSGSGKSTLLMLAGGWLVPDGGELHVPGSRPGAPPLWLDTSYLAQRFGLLPELSVRENIALPLRGRRGGDGGAAESIADRLGVLDLLERWPRETSLGQQQRVALARALVARPTLVLADEPTAHQDPASAERVWGALRAACDAGTACLVATHDERLAARADGVWLIEDGEVRPG